MIKITQEFDVTKDLKNLKNSISDIIDDEMLKAVADLQRNSPVGATKQLKSGWDLEPATIRGQEIVFKIINKAENALQRLEGRKAGKPPPSNALESWVAFKLKVPTDKVKSVAFLVARKIGREGTERSNRNFKEFDPKTGDPARGSAIARAIIRIDKKINQLK